MKYLIGIVVLVILLLGILSCKRINTSTTITKDSTTTIKFKDSSLVVLGSHIQKLINQKFGDSLVVGKLYSYYDSLHRTQLNFMKDSLGNLKVDCVTNNIIHKFTYPEKNTVVHTKETVVKEVEVKVKELPFLTKLLIGVLILMNLILLIVLLIVLFKKRI